MIPLSLRKVTLCIPKPNWAYQLAEKALSYCELYRSDDWSYSDTSAKKKAAPPPAVQREIVKKPLDAYLHGE
jgi:hypothetical protein